MKQLQDKIFAETEKLVGTFSILRVLIYTLISAAIIIALLFAFSFPVDLYTGSFALLISFVYSFVRDFFLTKYSKKVMYGYYEYLKEKKPRIELYIPIFQRTRQGIFLKKAGLYFDQGELYMEAFNQGKSRNKPQDSVSVKRGRDFALDTYHYEYDSKIATFHARFMETDYRFSMANVREVVELIDKSKGV